MAKNIVINKHGAKIRMNDAALRIAEKHFGINRSRPTTKETPIELLKLPKRIDIIKAIPLPDKKLPKIEVTEKIVAPVEKVEEVKAEAPKKAAKKKAPKK